MLTTSPGLQMDVERGPDWLLVRIENLDSDDVEAIPLANILWNLLQKHLAHRLVLELDQIDVLNSYLIGQLVRLYKLIDEQDGVMRLCGLSPYNREVLQTCRLDDRLLSYRDRRAAVMAGRGPAWPR